MKHLILLLALALSLGAAAQNAYEYNGDRIDLETHYFNCQYMGKLSGNKKQPYLGFATSGNIAVSTQNGSITIYRIAGTELRKIKQLKLAEAGSASFGTDEQLFVSNAGNLAAMKLSDDHKTIESTSLITIKSAKPNFWVADAESPTLYALTNKSGKLSVLKFAQPSGETELNAGDSLEQFTLSSGTSTLQIKGLCVSGGLLFATTATQLYVWDLATRSLRNVINLKQAIKAPVSHCSVSDGTLLVTAQGQVYQLTF